MAEKEEVARELFKIITGTPYMGWEMHFSQEGTSRILESLVYIVELSGMDIETVYKIAARLDGDRQARYQEWKEKRKDGLN